MMNIKELAKWLKKEVEFLKENPDYMGSFKKLDDYFAVVLQWEEGYDKEKDDTVIQNPNDMSWALNASVKIWESGSSIEDWLYPYLQDSDEMLAESISISPDENYESLAEYLLETYRGFEGHTPNDNGSVSFDNPPDEIAAILEPEELKEENEIELQTVNTKEFLDEFKKSVFDKFDEYSVDYMNFVDIEPNSDYDPNGYVFTVTIDGDWKHAHILSKSIVKDLLESFGFTLLGHDENVLPNEDDSEDIGEVYTADHTWAFKI